MKQLPIGPCPGPAAHEGHEVVEHGRRVPETHPRAILTIWRCPVEGWGGFWYDLSRDPMRGGIGGGPPLTALPARP